MTVPGLNEAESAEYERRWRREVVDGEGNGQPVGLLSMTVTDRTDATEQEFRSRIAAFDAAVTPPEVREAAVVEEVARGIRRAWLLSFDNRDDWDFAEDDTRIHYRRLAAAAVAAYRATGGAEA